MKEVNVNYSIQDLAQQHGCTVNESGEITLPVCPDNNSEQRIIGLLTVQLMRHRIVLSDKNLRRDHKERLVIKMVSTVNP